MGANYDFSLLRMMIDVVDDDQSKTCSHDDLTLVAHRDSAVIKLRSTLVACDDRIWLESRFRLGTSHDLFDARMTIMSKCIRRSNMDAMSISRIHAIVTHTAIDDDLAQ
jgi:hypothetical protein